MYRSCRVTSPGVPVKSPGVCESLKGSPGGDLRPRFDLKLAHDVADMAVNRPLGEHQRFRDLAVGAPRHDQQSNFPLANGEPCDVRIAVQSPPGRTDYDR